VVKRVAVFSTRNYDREALERVPGIDWEWHFLEEALDSVSVRRAEGASAICVFVNDVVDAAVLRQLELYGIRLVALRCAGYNNVDLGAASEHGIAVVNVPHYTPDAVAEHTLLLMLALLRNLVEAERRISRNNYSIDGLEGRLLSRLKVGLVGCGDIGSRVAKLLAAFGCEILISDPYVEQDKLPGQKVALVHLLQSADVVSLHCPLTDETKHMIDSEALGLMRERALLINTARGGLIDTQAVLEALERGSLGGFGCDVYAKEAGIFFFDHSGSRLDDPLLECLVQHPRVVVTAHQGFLVEEALLEIAETTCKSLTDFYSDRRLTYRVT